MTDEGRRKQIEKALAARADKEPAERHSHPLPWRGDEEYFPVIDLPLDVPLLNADSHRIRAELESPGLDFVRKDRTSEPAQERLAELWRGAHRKFGQLKESLSSEGQTEPGVVTRAGVLVNGNTRLVALRELNEPARQWIRLAVLPGDATPLELAKLELRLQVRDPLRDPYKLSNELLFVEEMARQHKMTDEQIAQALGWHPSRPATGKRKVSQHRRILQLIRDMQMRDPKLPIVFFDDKLQHLKELEQRYSQLVDAGENEQAGLLLDTWLVVGRGGYSSVHQIRAVTSSDDFVGEYLLPSLSAQDRIGDRAAALVQGKRAKKSALPGVGDLETDGGPRPGAYDLKPLIRIVERDDDDDAAAVSGAIKDAISGWKVDNKAEDELIAPVESLRSAGRELRKAAEAYSELHGTKEFEHTVRGDFDYQLKQVRKQLKKLDELMSRETANVG